MTLSPHPPPRHPPPLDLHILYRLVLVFLLKPGRNLARLTFCCVLVFDSNDDNAEAGGSHPVGVAALPAPC